MADYNRRFGVAQQAARPAPDHPRHRGVQAIVAGRGMSGPGAGFGQALSKVNGWFWGYGERLSVLLRNLVLAVVLVFPVLYWWSGDLRRGDGMSLGLLDYLYFSIVNALPVGVSSIVSPSSWIGYSLVVLESVFGAVTLALFAAYVFRWSLHR